ncbi:DNA-directed RNA polymerase subunit alpha, partial [Patescibacteria group bacterium]|nr:DNA-directed RNA polymerase subunit alpha [Patescibacteria group bacterium]
MEGIIVPQTIKLEKEEANVGHFVIEPCYPGYGNTLGNALRRVMLSSLPGAAVSGVKIKGVSHEFSTLEHIKEDAVEIILNLKKVRFNMHSEEPVKLKLVSKGKKEIKAGDFEKISEVEVVNKDQLIATAVHKDTDFDMEVVIEKGRGYVSVEQKENNNLEIGMILIDSIFSPITNVSYEVENMRVGQRTDYDRLRIIVETDGTITPKEVLSESSRILADHFSFITGAKEAKKEEEELEVEQVEEEEEDEVMGKLVQELNLSTRTANALDKAKIRKVGDLVQRSE